MEASKPAASSSWGRRSAAALGVGTAKTTASACSVRAPTSDQPSALPFEALDAGGEPGFDAPALEAGSERLHQRGHATVESPEQGRPVGVRFRHFGA